MTLRAAYGHHGRVFDVAFSPASDMIVSASEDGTARVWRFDNMCQVSLLSGHSAEVMRVSWKRDGSIIATGAIVLSCTPRPL
jgi:WD40 repeat protein